MADMKPRVGKPPLGLLPRYGLEAAAGGMEHGVGKYWPRNYEDCPPDEAFLYVHAILRHAVALASGEFIDPESGVPHVALLLSGGMIYCQITKTGYTEPNVMREHPERKARLNSMQAMFGPRPPHPPDVKQNADTYHVLPEPPPEERIHHGPFPPGAGEGTAKPLGEITDLIIHGGSDQFAYKPDQAVAILWTDPVPPGLRFDKIEIRADVPRSAAANIKITQARTRLRHTGISVDKRAPL